MASSASSASSQDSFSSQSSGSSEEWFLVLDAADEVRFNYFWVSQPKTFKKLGNHLMPYEYRNGTGCPQKCSVEYKVFNCLKKNNFYIYKKLITYSVWKTPFEIQE